MTEITLNENEFIIKLDNDDLLSVIEGKVDPKLRLINPHKENYKSDHLQVIKILLSSIGICKV